MLPGACDPATYALPQTFIAPRVVLPMASAFADAHCSASSSGADAKTVRESALRELFVSNPFEFSEHGVRFLVLSGQSVDDMRRASSSLDSSLDILEQMLCNAHYAPSAPDTLVCQPYADSDPFCIVDNNVPDAIIVGNQDNFSTRLVHVRALGSSAMARTVRLVSIPSFARDRTVVHVALDAKRTTTCTVFASLSKN